MLCQQHMLTVTDVPPAFASLYASDTANNLSIIGLHVMKVGARARFSVLEGFSCYEYLGLQE